MVTLTYADDFILTFLILLSLPYLLTFLFSLLTRLRFWCSILRTYINYNFFVYLTNACPHSSLVKLIVYNRYYKLYLLVENKIQWCSNSLDRWKLKLYSFIDEFWNVGHERAILYEIYSIIIFIPFVWRWYNRIPFFYEYLPIDTSTLEYVPI